MADVLSPLLAYAAGALTILSPCVLPLVPIVLGSAAQAHRRGPLALAAGLVASFTLTGFLLATLGAASGFDGDWVRLFGAGLLVAAGAALLVPAAQGLLTRAATPLANWAGARRAGMEQYGLAGQAAIGVLLGLVWSPCVGPTLGAATVLAAQGENLASVAMTMAAFGMGIASVLLVLAFATRSLLARWRGRLMTAGGTGKQMLGGLLMVVGVLIFTGGDKLFEGVLVQASPDWLVDLTTSI
ncbi:MAG: cytochrome c biogenesis CcdA family protein [Novosphingobium sp.]